MFRIDYFLNSLPVMLMGMAGIFIVTGVIILAIMLLNKITEKKSEKTKPKE